MSALSSARKRRSPVEVISQWWQVWTNDSPAQKELTCCAEGEVERIAKDIGMPASEIRRLASLGPNPPNSCRAEWRHSISTAKRSRERTRKRSAISSASARCVKVTGSAHTTLRAMRATRPGRIIARTSQRCGR